jgi:hypothetical protein
MAPIVPNPVSKVNEIKRTSVGANNITTNITNTNSTIGVISGSNNLNSTSNNNGAVNLLNNNSMYNYLFIVINFSIRKSICTKFKTWKSNRKFWSII